MISFLFYFFLGIVKHIPNTTKTVLTHKEYSEKKEKERKEKERLEQKEKFSVPQSSSSSFPLQSSSQNSSSAITSNSSIPHSRSQSTMDSYNNRKLGPADGRHLVPSHSVPINKPSVHPQYFPKDAIKRDIPRSSDAKLEKVDHSDSNDLSNIKISSDNKLSSSNIDYIKHSTDIRYLSKNNDKKLESKSVKQESKPLSKSSRNQENQEVKSEFNLPTNRLNPPPLPVVEPKIFVKSDFALKANPNVKPEIPDIKVHNNSLLEDFRITDSSFIFNNDDFSLRDFLNPSAMPPEDIFDTESSDSKGFKDDIGFSKADLLSFETTHVKLLSPQSGLSSSSASAQNERISPDLSNKRNSSKNNNHISGSKAQHTPSNLEVKPNSKQHPSPQAPSSLKPQLLHTNVDKNLNNTVLPRPISASVPSQSNNSSNVKKRDRKSPIASNYSIGDNLPPPPPPSTVSTAVASTRTTSSTISSKSKVPLSNSDSALWLSSLTKGEELQRQAAAAAAAVVSSKTSSLSSQPQQILGMKAVVSAGQSTTTAVLSSSSPLVTSTPKISHSNVVNTKLVSSSGESSLLNERLVSQPHNVDTTTSINNNKLPSFKIPDSLSPVQQQSTLLKKHKHEHGHHKHKKKKKHKHKDGSKHRDKEKKKSKKHKKHKDKDKEKQQQQNLLEKGGGDPSSLPLKITLRTKDVYSQDSGMPVVQNTLPSNLSHVYAKHPQSTSSNLNTVTGIKLTIPKSRLQDSAPSNSEQLNVNMHDIGHPKVKLKLPKESSESYRKRVRDDLSSLHEGLHHPSKIARGSSRSSSNYASSQVSSTYST